MIYTCLPSGNSHGWGLAGTRINQELARLDSVTDVSACAGATDYDGPLLMAVTGPDFAPMNLNPRGTSTTGYAFIEQPLVAKDYVDACHRYYDALVCGSTWMAEKMREIGVEIPISVALQGVDFDLFKLEDGPPSDQPFTIFSGGKFEYRKGQDIVIATFKKFLEKHPEAKLIAAWGNHWPDTMRSMEQSKLIDYKHVSMNWKTNVLTAIAAHGIPLTSVIIPQIDEHEQMPALYRRAHVGLFPNRAEAGTNLVMCEAIATGMPVIASWGTGHLDVEGCVWSSLYGRGQLSDGWWNPPIEAVEILSRLLEYAYDNYAETRRDSTERRIKLARTLSWDKCAKSIYEAMLNAAI